MRNSLKTSASIILAAILAVSALTASPAFAGSFLGGGFHGGGFHGGGLHGGGFHGGGFHGGGYGLGALAALGVAGFAADAILGAGGSSNNSNCLAYNAVYDANGNYRGLRPANNC
jgi:hypothetical protein